MKRQYTSIFEREGACKKCKLLCGELLPYKGWCDWFLKDTVPIVFQIKTNNSNASNPKTKKILTENTTGELFNEFD